MDQNGNIKWKKYYGPALSANNSQLLRSLNLGTDGSFLLATEFWLSPKVHPFSIMKIDSIGGDTLSIACNNFSGIKDDNLVNGGSFNIFPNPATDFVTFKIDADFDKIFTLIITDIRSIEIEKVKLAANKELKLSLADYPSGIYLVSLSQNDRIVERRKLIKQ